MKRIVRPQLSEQAHSKWDGADRRRYTRWHVPKDGGLMLKLETSNGSRELVLADVSRGGLAVRVTQEEVRLARGMQVKLQAPIFDAVFEASVARIAHDRIGFTVPDQTVLARLVEQTQNTRAVAVQNVDGTLHVSGFLGFDARVELRLSRHIDAINLARANGIDIFGLGLLAGHVEKGCQLSGCQGVVADFVNLARFCERACAWRDTGGARRCRADN